MTLRERIFEMILQAGEGHIPSAFSIIDILEHLYAHVLKHDPRSPGWSDRDYFILSKGHGCAALYAVLEKHGYLQKKEVDNFSRFESILGGHPDRTKMPGAEASTGSLGHGLGIAAGLTAGLRIQGKPNRVFALVGDAECNEGTIWETALIASHRQLGSLVCIVDNNRSASVVLPMPNFVKKFEAFGWEAQEIDGHSGKEIKEVFSKIQCSREGKPIAIIANTIKGKGISFMEADFGYWHHRTPVGKDLEQAWEELKAI